jgi:hypothetical protein
MNDKSNTPFDSAHAPDGTIQNKANENTDNPGAITSRKREWYSRG